MAKVSRVRRLRYRCRNEKVEGCLLRKCSRKISKDMKKPCKPSEKKDWEDATCSVCMESPHNAVLLLCSSYNKGCRPYMCATNYRFSNCLDQYKKAYIEGNPSDEKTQVCQLLCPLCRGQVKGWTLIEPARKYLNKKKRTCMQENCTFVGNYKELKNHVKADHPWGRPREVDPSLEEKWKTLENQREYNDVISAIAPGAVVFGDYVLDYDIGMDDLLSEELELLHRTSRREYYSYDGDNDIGVRRNSSLVRDVGDEIVPFSRNHRRMVFFSRPHIHMRWR